MSNVGCLYKYLVVFIIPHIFHVWLAQVGGGLVGQDVVFCSWYQLISGLFKWITKSAAGVMGSPQFPKKKQIDHTDVGLALPTNNNNIHWPNLS